MSLFIASRRVEHDGSRRIVAAGVRSKFLAEVMITPGYGTADESDATIDALTTPWETARATARETP